MSQLCNKNVLNSQLRNHGLPNTLVLFSYRCPLYISQFLTLNSVVKLYPYTESKTHYWIIHSGLIRTRSLRMKAQKDQTINKKNKSIIHWDIGILSLLSTAPSIAHENYRSENILYQRCHIRSMNNLSPLSLSEKPHWRAQKCFLKRAALRYQIKQTLFHLTKMLCIINF